ncbi:MAG: serpin family protein [Prolixibacteraceae bacterium]
MKKKISMKILFTILIVVAAIGSCQEEKPSENKEDMIEFGEKSTQLIEADNDFGLHVFQKINEEKDDENKMISPLSISVALAMAYNGADGETKAEMEQALNLKGLSVEQINSSYKSLIAALQSLDKDVVFEIANALFYAEGFTVKPQFFGINEHYYDAEVESLDFKAPESVDVINNWVAEKTNSKIQQIIDQLSPLDRMILLNAVYFNGIWTNTFDEEGTKMKTFRKSDGATTEVPMMSKEDQLDYTSNSLFSAVRMPYGNGQYNMMVFLPENGKNSNDVIAALSGENWKNRISGFESKDQVVVTMPRFKFAFELEMNNVLKEMGIQQAFNPEQSDFSGIADMDDLHISSVVHKTFIDVNETGTEAAAVTSVTIGITSVNPDQEEKIYFTVDKPFVFAITEKDTGAILFIGEVNNPEYD